MAALTKRAAIIHLQKKRTDMLRYLFLMFITITAQAQLVKICPLDEHSITKDSGLDVSSNTVYLNTATTEKLSGTSFHQLIQEHHAARTTPYFLALSTNCYDPSKVLSIYDAQKLILTPHLEPRIVEMDCLGRIHPAGQSLVDTMRERILGNSVEYYTINSAHDTQAEFFCSDSELREEPKREKFVENFFQAHPDNTAGFYNLYMAFRMKRTINLARYFLQKAADKNHPMAQHEIGNMFEEENNFEKAQHYYQLAADQNVYVAEYSLNLLQRKMEGPSTPFEDRLYRNNQMFLLQKKLDPQNESQYAAERDELENILREREKQSK